VDKEFAPDNSGHCDGLRKAFTPRAFFVCCLVVNESVVMATTTLSSVIIESVEEEISPESIESIETEETTATSTSTTFPTEETTTTSSPTEESTCSDRTNRLAADPSSSNPCWTAAITRSHGYTPDSGSFLCTGALITPTALLTTATCVSRLFGQDLGGFKVVLGSGRIIHPNNGVTKDGVSRDVTGLVIHEEYGVVGGMVRGYDVG
jgi:hypothetical protein